MNISKRLLGAEDLETLIIMANLASTYSSQGKRNEAKQLKVQVLDMSKKLLDAEHLDILRLNTSMGNLARTYANQGNFHEAEQVEAQVFSMSKRLLGAEHPNTLISMSSLACIYSSQGKWNEAKQLNVEQSN